MRRYVITLLTILFTANLIGCQTIEKQHNEDVVTKPPNKIEATPVVIPDVTEEDEDIDLPKEDTEETNSEENSSEETNGEEAVNGSYYVSEEHKFNLPINGATGYGIIQLNMRKDASLESELLIHIPPGEGFEIVEETGDWWKVHYKEYSGYVYHDYCMINLPDVVPSAVYYNTNAFSSVFQSSYYELPGVTGEQLYDTYLYNERLDKEEYVMPILYCAAKKIAQAQSAAMENGDTLILYETYRPYDVQQKIVTTLNELKTDNKEVEVGITTEPWGISWFISTSISKHQKGYAMDVSLGKIIDTKEKNSGPYIYREITEYEEYEMPTPIHELSMRSVSMAYPVTSSNDEDWRSVPLAESMNESAIQLRTYCTDAGFSPLASEWWHFNDLENEGPSDRKGNFFIRDLCSKLPK